MGFIKETYTNGNAGLVVNFALTESNDTFCASDSVKEAMKHFGLYLDKNNNLRVESDSERAMDALEIDPSDAKDFREKIDTLLITLTDNQAIENTVLFPAWSVNNNYKVDERVRYNGILYRVLQEHTAQADWTPLMATSLFARVLNETENDVIPEWTQPDSTNGYMNGDRVIHNGIIYVSTADNNIWEPNTVGAPWSIEETSAENDAEIINEWNSDTTYAIGDCVMYEDIKYRSIIDNNSWSPKDYPAGWEIIE